MGFYGSSITAMLSATKRKLFFILGAVGSTSSLILDSIIMNTGFRN